MKIELRLYASLCRLVPEAKKRGGLIPLDVEEGMTIREVLKERKVPIEKVKLIFLNGKRVTAEEHLTDGDRLGVFPPVAGG